MKKTLVAVLAFATLATYQAMASIDLGLQVGEIEDSSGAPTTGGAMAILVADTSGGGMASLGNNLDPASSLANGGFIQATQTGGLAGSGTNVAGSGRMRTSPTGPMPSTGCRWSSIDMAIMATVWPIPVTMRAGSIGAVADLARMIPP